MISVLPQKRGAQSIHILNVYCPPHLQRVTFAELFYRALQAAARQPLVVVGDFNAPSPHWGYHYEKARGRKLKELISTLGKCAKSGAQPASRTGQLFAPRLSPCSHPRRTTRHGHHTPSTPINHTPDAFALTAEAADYSAQLADTNWVDTCMKAAGQMSSKSTWRLFRSLLDPSTTRGETQRQLRRAYYAYQGPTSQLANDLCDRYLCRTVDPKGPEYNAYDVTTANQRDFRNDSSRGVQANPGKLRALCSSFRAFGRNLVQVSCLAQSWRSRACHLGDARERSNPT
ncbi:hypothetical protein HPB49_011966 [Dermacentor silvarum]|uniref:Uncharacterized protein n=1 Tax=Dermacentor silvarum TaxID=543639 RepID=A0ACB8CX15_DERSI|nr:hypothetical protein HPB49_011966 [Dermacentor silvarum]